MTLEDYIRYEMAEGKIDFSFRALATADGVLIYIHPAGRTGRTTPNLLVKGNVVERHPGSSSPEWND